MSRHFLTSGTPAEWVSDFLAKCSFHIPPDRATEAFVGHDSEQFNLILPSEYAFLLSRLKPLNFLPAFSSFSMACLLQLAVAAMPQNQVYLNIGVWQGYTFFAGLIEQANKTCIGVDNFSEFAAFGTPKETFYKDFARFSERSPNHHFYELDYQVYFNLYHQELIGVYFYDAAHTYQDQLQALELADPFLAPGALVFIDDANQSEVQEATLFFLAANPHYVVLASLKTAHNGHPSFWNGLIILHKCL